MLTFNASRRDRGPSARGTATLRLSPAMPAGETSPSQDPQEPGSTCGWFDSSWDLRQGLRVIEHMDFERLPPEVPLSWLLQ